ncbi:MAG: MarR family transcriptional regulator [Alphaproteobacteria bacterium HGW-Alphaproteobacteria-2]|nr:MAG: MarR family transcriptional regulator [Alphaproteobacteria bacterium HGW-Alphaproteobacteria-2]
MTAPVFDLDAFLPYRVAMVSRRLSRIFEERYRDRFGISVAEWRVVAHLAQSGAVSVREIVARTDMEKSRVSRAAARLEAAGYVAKCTHSGDRRLVELTLTARGRAMMTELAPIAEAFNAEIGTCLGADADAFRRALDRLFASA